MKKSIALFLFIAVSFVAVSQSKEEKKVEYIEVLYLKNGSIIRGMIIEQIPNVQVKIQTSDGSVFVYTMDQVLKITKEPK